MRYCQVLTEKLESERKKSTELEQLSEALMKNIRSASEREIELSRQHEELMLKVKCYQRVLAEINK